MASIELSKRRAAAAVIAGMILTWPTQIYLGAVKSTQAFADADAEYVLATWAWVVYVCVAAAIGFGLSYGFCVFLTRRLRHAVRRRVRTRFLMSLGLIVLLSALALVDSVEFTPGETTQQLGITPFMITVWIAGPVAAVFVMVRAARAPVAVGEG